MKCEDSRNILILHAIEQCDAEESFFPLPERQRASAEAGAPLDRSLSQRKENAFFSNRAKFALSQLAQKDTALAGELALRERPSLLPKFCSILLLAAAAVAGFLSNDLSSVSDSGRINILHFPLIGIVLWNVIVCLNEIGLLFSKKRQKFQTGIVHMIGQLLHRNQPREEASAHEDSPIVARAFRNFDRRWRSILIPIQGASIKTLLHVTALTLALSTIAGMYVKGISNEYRAVWESTFIESGEELRPFLQIALGPAAALSEQEIPSAGQLDEIRHSSESSSGKVTGDNAAKWIHWYAITIGLFVGIPRLVFALFWRMRAAHLQRSIPFRKDAEGYFQRLIAISSGTSMLVSVLPYAHKPGESVRRQILHAVEEQFDRPITLQWADPIPFGEEEDWSPSVSDEATAAPSPEAILLLFNFSSTPERETHLTLYQSVRQHFAENGKIPVFLDAEAFDRKSASFRDAEKRREDRLESWQQIFSRENCEIHVISA